MASSVDIANRALSKLGEARIISFEDDNKAARAMKAAFDIVRDSEFRTHRWHFTKKRITLPELSTAPAFGWDHQYQLPSDFIQLIQVGQYDPIVPLTDYRLTTESEWAIESGDTGNVILTNHEAPLQLRYVSRIADTTRFDSAFVEVLSCRLAVEVCEELTQSTTKKESAREDYKVAMMMAIRANAIELPPQTVQDQSWVTARL